MGTVLYPANEPFVRSAMAFDLAGAFVDSEQIIAGEQPQSPPVSVKQKPAPHAASGSVGAGAAVGRRVAHSRLFVGHR